jgi:hypothetical protein
MILLATQGGLGSLLIVGLFGFFIMMALKPGSPAGYHMRKKKNYRNSRVDNIIIEKVVVHNDERRKVQHHPWTPKIGTLRTIRVKDVDGVMQGQFTVLTGHSYYRTEPDPTDPSIDVKVLCTSNTIIDDYLAAGKDADEIRDELL